MPTERTARSDRPCRIHEIRLNPVPFESDPILVKISHHRGTEITEIMI